MRPLVAVLLAAAPAFADSPAAVDALRQHLAAGGSPADPPAADTPLTKADAAVARDLLWKAHVERVKKDRAAELKDRKLTDGKLEMPFAVRPFGEKPAAGHSLWLSPHGGGNAPARVDDGQWENQKRLYKLDEGLYVAPRAPTNTWNLWHEAHIDRLFARLIEDFVVLEGVDPDRVYVLG
jgi:hypothetical protein